MKPVSDQLFVFERAETLRPGYERCLAKDLGLKEAWLRDAIFETPELVIGPCRAAGLTEDDWYPWAREFRVEVGKIDVLLLSSEGRVAVVETKLAGNPELRRRVLAQALDYLAHLADGLREPGPGGSYCTTKCPLFILVILYLVISTDHQRTFGERVAQIRGIRD